MIDRIAVDTNPVIAWFRSGTSQPFAIGDARYVALLLPVVAELYFGAFASSDRQANIAFVEEFVTKHDLVTPDGTTARIYGQLRARHRLDNIRASKMNDVWIAALCIQHELPLLTNDRGFDSFENLQVLHW